MEVEQVPSAPTQLDEMTDIPSFSEIVSVSRQKGQILYPHILFGYK